MTPAWHVQQIPFSAQAAEVQDAQWQTAVMSRVEQARATNPMHRVQHSASSQASPTRYAQQFVGDEPEAAVLVLECHQ